VISGVDLVQAQFAVAGGLSLADIGLKSQKVFSIFDLFVNINIQPKYIGYCAARICYSMSCHHRRRRYYIIHCFIKIIDKKHFNFISFNRIRAWIHTRHWSHYRVSRATRLWHSFGRCQRLCRL